MRDAIGSDAVIQVGGGHGSHGGGAEEVLYIDDTQPADLHVVAGEGGAHSLKVTAELFDDHHVVGAQPVATLDQVEGAFALPHTTGAREQDANAENVKGISNIPLGTNGANEWPEFVWLDA